MKRLLLKSTSLGTGLAVLLLAGGGQAVAQEAAPADGTVSGVVVTGSLLSIKGYSQPTPVMVQAADELLQRRPTTLAESLNSLPQFNAVAPRAERFSGVTPGAYLNLRALGATRNLVLLDGDRVVDTRGQGGVDAYMLPELLTQRVDVVTGGASAAYGSDAVAGVVNYVTNKRFEGVRFVAQAGVSKYGDDASRKLGVAYGGSALDDRLHFAVSGQYFHQDGTPVSSRPRQNELWFQAGNGTTVPYSFVPGVVANDAAFGGVVLNAQFLPVATATAPLAGTLFTSATTTRPFQFGASIPGNTQQFTVGGDGYDLRDAYKPLTRLDNRSAFARVSFDLSPTTELFARLNVARSHSDDISNFTSLTNNRAATIFSGNAFLPASVQTAMTAAGLPSFIFGRQGRDLEKVQNYWTTNLVDLSLGANGQFNSAWSWSLRYGYGRSKILGQVRGNTLLANLYASLDAVRDTGGNIVCRVTVTNPGAFPGCVPINLFGEGSPSDAAKAFIHGTSEMRGTNTQQIASAVVRGELWSLPGGKVGLAAGGEYRHRTLVQVADARSLAQLNVTGIRGVPTRYCVTATACQTGQFFTGNFGNARGDDDIYEGFVETRLPFLADSAIGDLTGNGAIRHTRYSTIGNVTTWKLGGEWEPIEGLRGRVTRSRDIRAPNLYELYAGAVGSSFTSVTDPVAAANYTTYSLTRGNQNLKEEVAHTWTAGVVAQPRFLPRFSASVDYFDIRINDALASSVGAQQVVNNCVAGDQVACSNIVRNPADNRITNILLQSLNLTSLRVSGVDLEASYSLPLLGGNLRINALGSKISRYRTASGGIVQELAGLGQSPTTSVLSLPNWKGNLTFFYARGAFNLTIDERFVGPMNLNPGPGRVYAEAFSTVSTQAYTNVTASLRVYKQVDLFVNVNNLFNHQPPVIQTNVAAGVAMPTVNSLYDIEGRYYTVGFRGQF